MHEWTKEILLCRKFWSYSKHEFDIDNKIEWNLTTIERGTFPRVCDDVFFFEFVWNIWNECYTEIKK